MNFNYVASGLSEKNKIIKTTFMSKKKKYLITLRSIE